MSANALENTLELQRAYAECERIARAHYENFPVGSLLVPKRLRPHFYSLYAFMRTADDFADLPDRPREERLRLIEEWREQLRECFDATSTRGHAVSQTAKQQSTIIFLALKNTIKQFALEQSMFELMLDAFEFDARDNVRFETFDDLHWYTIRSAEPVGQLVLALFGYSDLERIQLSNDICSALQLINFLQDIKADIANGRCYIPIEDLQKFRIHSPHLIESSQQSEALIEFECSRIENMLVRGRALPAILRGRLRYEINATLAGADMMLAKIRVLGPGIFSERPALSPSERRKLLFKAII